MPLADLAMFKALAEAEGAGVTPEEISELTETVASIAEEVELILAQIDETFQQYTLHDIRHSRNVINLMWSVLPEAAREALNPLEVTFLLLAALLHDIGMYMDEDERQATLVSEGYDAFKIESCDRFDELETARSSGLEERAQAMEMALLAEYVRRSHAERSAAYVRNHLRDRLVFREECFADRLADLCESHVWPVLEDQSPSGTNSVESLPTSAEYPVGSIPVNVRYLGCLLRLADIMDFDRSRTPSAVFDGLLFTEEKSWEEWNKHRQVGGWEVTSGRVRYRVECMHPAFYVAVHEFLDAVDRELRDAQYLIDHFGRSVPEYYALELPQVVDRRGVGMKDPRYIAGAFRFGLDSERVMELLMDKALYPESSLFLRELLQNSLDACRRLSAIHADSGSECSYQPRITVWDHSSDVDQPRVVFQDNGVGMSLGVVEEFFMRVGRSYYRSSRFEGERRRLSERDIELEASSQFGIGILSCFLVADAFTVETYQYGFDPLRISVEGRTQYFLVERLPRPAAQQFPVESSDHETEKEPLEHPGTRVIVPLTKGVALDVEGALRTLAVNSDVSVQIHQPGQDSQAVTSFHWEAQAKERLCPNVHLPRRAGDGLDREALEENLNSVLTRSVIDFQRWDFSTHIRGAAWFWLLRGEEFPEIVRGDLSIEQQLSPTGLAQWVQDVRVTWRDKPEGREEAMALVDKGNTPDELLAGKRRRWGHLADIGSKVPLWSEYPDDTKYAALKAALTLPSDGAESWYDTPGLPLQMLEGKAEWLGTDVRIGALNSHPPDRVRLHGQGLALHGILVPGGIAKWEPQRAHMRAATLMPVQGTAWLDFRGLRAPIPAANRLFVHAETQGMTALVPFYRAVWRHTLEVLGADNSDSPRRKWAQRVLQAALHHALASDQALLLEEMALLDESVPYQVVCDGELGYALKKDVIEEFGAEVAVVRRSSNEWDGDGLVWNDEFTRWMIQLHSVDEQREPRTAFLSCVRTDLHSFTDSS